jgi:hypothetical protein
MRDWVTVRVFVSSTFLDMQAERDYLVRFVFPRLREELLPRRIHLDDVDLRWGITSEQSVVEACREIIDECRPRFVCLLGGRYGKIRPQLGTSVTADEIHHAIDDPAQTYRFFYYRDPEATASVPLELAEQYVDPPGSQGETLLRELKARIAENHEPRVYPAQWDGRQQRFVGLEPLGLQVCADLLRSINEELGSDVPALPDEDAQERAAMEAYIAERVRQYVVGSRAPLLDQMLAFARGEGKETVLLLTGAPGVGKSALLAQLCRGLTSQDPEALLLPHFVGASACSTDLRRTLERLCRELAAVAGVEPNLPQEMRDLMARFGELLAQAAEGRRIILVLDALNQLDRTDNAHLMHWLPQPLPDGVRIVASSLEGPAADALRRRQDVEEKPLEPLAPKDSLAIAESFLKRYGKRLAPDQRQALLEKPEAGNPLYLLVALEDLRTLGTHELTPRIEALAGEVQPLFRSILTERLSNDPGFRDESGQLIGKPLVRGFVSLIGASRHGLSHAELAELLAPGDPPDRLGNVAALECLLRPYLMRRGEFLDFAHTQLREAVEAEYLDEPEERRAAHVHLAAYFHAKADPTADASWQGSPRALSELPHHQTNAEAWGPLEKTLTDLRFIEAKCDAGMTYPLVADYNAALSFVPAGHQTRAVPSSPSPSPVTCNLSPALEPFRRFVRANAHIFSQGLEWVLQRAYNSAASGAVAQQAGAILHDCKTPTRPWLRLLNRPLREPDPVRVVLSTLRGHSDSVRAVAVSEDSEWAITAGDDSEVRLWDLAGGEGRLLWLHRHGAFAVALAPNGRTAVSAGGHGCVRAIDLGTTRETEWTDGDSSVFAVGVTDDGESVFYGRTDGYVGAWEPATGRARRLCTLTAAVNGLAVTPHGDRVFVASDQGVLVLSGAGGEVTALPGHEGRVWSVSVSSDGRTALSGGEDGTLRLWSAPGSGSLLSRHPAEVLSVSLSRDGSTAAAGSIDGYVRTYGLRSGELLTERWVLHCVFGVALHRNGSRVLVALDNGEVRDISATPEWPEPD